MNRGGAADASVTAYARLCNNLAVVPSANRQADVLCECECSALPCLAFARAARGRNDSNRRPTSHGMPNVPFQHRCRCLLPCKQQEQPREHSVNSLGGRSSLIDLQCPCSAGAMESSSGCKFGEQWCLLMPNDAGKTTTNPADLPNTCSNSCASRTSICSDRHSSGVLSHVGKWR